MAALLSAKEYRGVLICGAIIFIFRVLKLILYCDRVCRDTPAPTNTPPLPPRLPLPRPPHSHWTAPTAAPQPALITPSYSSRLAGCLGGATPDSTEAFKMSAIKMAKPRGP